MGWIDLIIEKRCSQGDRFARIAIRRRKGAEVPGQHGIGRHIRVRLRRILAGPRALVTSKEEELILHDRAAHRASKLVALQRIPGAREGIPRVKYSVTDKFEKAAVKLVRPGLRDETD